jgi:hypothetical protein
VIDGSNFLLDWPNDDIKIGKFRSVIEYVNELKCKAKAYLSKETYYVGENLAKGDSKFESDWDYIQRKITDGIIILVPGSEDLDCIEYALEYNLPLLSRDNWTVWKKKFPELNWERLESLHVTKFEYEVGEKYKFICPDLDKIILKLEHKKFVATLEGILKKRFEKENVIYKSEIMKDFASEIITGFNRDSVPSKGWAEDMGKSIPDLERLRYGVNISNWISKNLPKQFGEIDGKIIMQ